MFILVEKTLVTYTIAVIAVRDISHAASIFVIASGRMVSQERRNKGDKAR
jgi:hypothetical protein